MDNIVGVAIEALVSVLLVATIIYCSVLDRRLRKLRSDEGAMRQTIGELVAATHSAERAIVALRSTVGSCEETLADRLGRAQALSAEMAGQLGAGEEVIDRITKIARAAREHASRLSAREDVERVGEEREAARLQARRDAEGERTAMLAREADAREAARIAAPPVSVSAATAAAAELFASRLRALSIGTAS